MKKIKVLGLFSLFTVCFLVMSNGIGRVYAVEPLPDPSIVPAGSPIPTNAVTKAYEENTLIVNATTKSKNPDNLKTTSIESTSAIMNLATLLFGPQSIGGKTTEIMSLPSYLRNAGLVNVSTGTMMYSFFAQPDMQVGSVYAHMFLPKEFVDTTAGSLFAADGPTTTFAGDELKAIKIDRVWSITFGLAMLAFIVVIVAAGFMVMFRTKLGGQSVVTVTMALQNMIVGVFMAVSSYAIGSFFITLSKFLILAISTPVASAFGLSKAVNLGGPLAVFDPRIIFSMTKNQSDMLVAATLTGVVVGIFGGPVGMAVTGALPIVIFTFMKIVFGILVIVASFKIFFAVLTTYIKMIVDIILAPILFVTAALPGRGDAYMSWIKRMFKNSLVAPMIFIFVNFAAFAFSLDGSTSNIISGLTGGTLPPGGASDYIVQFFGPGAVVSVILLMMAPSAPALLDDMFSGKGDGKAAGNALASVRETAAKVPVIGGFIGGK